MIGPARLLRVLLTPFLLCMTDLAYGITQQQGVSEVTMSRSSESLDERISAYLDEFTTPGAAVALIENGRVAFARGYGRADGGPVRVTRTGSGAVERQVNFDEMARLQRAIFFGGNHLPHIRCAGPLKHGH